MTLDRRSFLFICTLPLTYSFEPRDVPGMVRLEISTLSIQHVRQCDSATKNILHFLL